MLRHQSEYYTNIIENDDNSWTAQVRKRKAVNMYPRRFMEIILIQANFIDQESAQKWTDEQKDTYIKRKQERKERKNAKREAKLNGDILKIKEL